MGRRLSFDIGLGNDSYPLHVITVTFNRSLSSTGTLVIKTDRNVNLNFIRQLLKSNHFQQICNACHHPRATAKLLALTRRRPTLIPLIVSIARRRDVTDTITSLRTRAPRVRLIICYIKLLRSNSFRPRGDIHRLDDRKLVHSFRIGTVKTTLLAGRLVPLLGRNSPDLFKTVSTGINDVNSGHLNN